MKHVKLFEQFISEVVELVHVYDKNGEMFGTGELVKTKGKKSLIRWDGSREEWIDSSLVKLVEGNSISEKREDVGKYNTIKKVIAKLGRRPSEQDVAQFITDNYYDVTEVERGEDDPESNDKIADLVSFYKFDIDDWQIAWFDAQNESAVTEAKGGQIFPGDYVKTQYGDIYLRVDGKVGRADAYVRVIKGKAGKRKTGLHDSMKLTLVNKDGVEEAHNMEDIYDLISHHRFNKDFNKLSSKDKEWIENDAKERGFNESLLESDMSNMYYSLMNELYEAKAYKLKASEFGGDTHSAPYNVKGEPTWRVHSTYAIDQVSGENNADERDVVFFEAMPINNEIYIKIGGINNLKRTGATVGNNFGTTIEEWKNDPEGIAKEASEFLTDATHLKWINKKARSQGQVIKWALKDDYSSVIIDLVNKSLGLSESVLAEAKDNLYLQLHKKYAEQIKGLKAKKIKKLSDLVSVQRSSMEDREDYFDMDPKKKKELSAEYNEERKLFKKYVGGDESVMLPKGTEALTEAKIQYKKGKSYQTGNNWSVYMSSGQASFDIGVNTAASWSTDPNDEQGETFRLLDAGEQRAVITFKEGNIDSVAKQMHKLTDKTTWGEKNGLSVKDYADIIRVWIDMGIELHESAVDVTPESDVTVDNYTTDNGKEISAVEIVGAIVSSQTEDEFLEYFYDVYGQGAFTGTDTGTLLKYYNEYLEEVTAKETEEEEAEKEEGGEEEDPLAGMDI